MHKSYQYSFTIVELIFTIVIIAIIYSGAISNIAPSSQRVNLLKIKTDITLIKSEISKYHQKALLLNLDTLYPLNLDYSKHK